MTINSATPNMLWFLEISCHEPLHMAEELPHLNEALNDENRAVRQNAAIALEKIEPEQAKVAVPYLIEALNDEDKYVRMSAANALRRIGADAKTALPHLIILLNDYEGVRISAAIAIEHIATALQNSKDTASIPDLELVLAALQSTEFSERATRVSEAIEALRAIETVR